MAGVQSFGEKRALRRTIGRLCRSGVRSSNEKSLLLLGLIAREFARRICGRGQSGGAKGIRTDTVVRQATQCRSNPVSGRSLPKTGVFQMHGRDYRQFRPENPESRSQETDRKFAEARHWRAFHRILGTFSLTAALPGWGGRIRTAVLRLSIMPLKCRAYFRRFAANESLEI